MEIGEYEGVCKVQGNWGQNNGGIEIRRRK